MIVRTQLLRAAMLFAFLAAGTLHSHNPAQAEQNTPPVLVSRHGAWGLYRGESNGVRTCYLLTMPYAWQPSDRDHGDVYFMLSTWPHHNRYESQLKVGYLMNGDAAARLTIDNKAFPMYVIDNNAWLASKADEERVAEAVKSGVVLTVQSQSAKGTITRYRFSLDGANDALAQMRRICHAVS